MMIKEKHIPYLFGIALGIVALYLIPYVAASDDIKSLFIAFIYYLVFSAVFFVLHMMIHEMGHLVFALIAGYKFVSIRFFSLLIKKDAKGVKLSKHSVPGTAGQCLMEPKELEQGLNSAILYHAGGGLMNVLVSIIILLFALSIKNKGLLYAAMFYFSTIGFITAAANLIPLKLSGIVNDGYNIKLLKEDMHSLKASNAILIMNAKINQDFLYQDLDQDLLYYNADYDYNNPLLTSHFAFYINSLCEKKDFVKAQKLIQEVLEDSPDMVDYYKNFFAAENLFFDLCFHQVPETYDKRFKELGKYFMIHKSTTYANRQALSYYQIINDKENYQKHLEIFLKLKNKLSNKADILNETVLFELLDSQSKDRYNQ